MTKIEKEVLLLPFEFLTLVLPWNLEGTTQYSYIHLFCSHSPILAGSLMVAIVLTAAGTAESAVIYFNSTNVCIQCLREQITFEYLYLCFGKS
jgi:L-asparagine transporter-like permease